MSNGIDEFLDEIRARHQRLLKKVSLTENLELSDISDVGQRIRSERKVQKLTLHELCDLSDVGYSTLSRIERGDLKIKLESLIRVTKALGLNLKVG